MLDRLTAVELLKTEQGIQLAGPPITLEPYVVAARKADAGLMVEIDAAIRAMQQDGFLANLERRWLGPGATGLNPVDGERAAASP